MKGEPFHQSLLLSPPTSKPFKHFFKWIPHRTGVEASWTLLLHGTHFQKPFKLFKQNGVQVLN